MPTQNPRLNVTVTPEQHALLLELAELNGGSAAGYLRQMLDQATPLLRATVPALRLAAQEMNNSKEQASEALHGLLSAISDAGVTIQPDLLDGPSSVLPAPSGGRAASGSKRARARGGKA